MDENAGEGCHLNTNGGEPLKLGSEVNMNKPELNTEFVSVVFIALMLCSIFVGAVSAENVSTDLSDNAILNETGNSETFNSSDNYTLSSEIDGFQDINKPVFVFFHAEWCHLCEDQKSIIDTLEQEYPGKIAFFRVNAEENPQAYDYQLIRRQKAAMGDAP